MVVVVVVVSTSAGSVELCACLLTIYLVPLLGICTITRDVYTTAQVIRSPVDGFYSVPVLWYIRFALRSDLDRAHFRQDIYNCGNFVRVYSGLGPPLSMSYSSMFFVASGFRLQSVRSGRVWQMTLLRH